MNAPWRRLLRPLAVMAFLLIGAIVSNVVLAAAQCQTIKGQLTFQQVTGPECPSPTGLCTAGSLSGSLKGTFDFTASSITATVDTPSTSVIFYTGDSTLELKEGTMIIKQAGALSNRGRQDFAEVSTIMGGTGSYAGVSGNWRAEGLFGASNGEGLYRGEICYPAQ